MDLNSCLEAHKQIVLDSSALEAAMGLLEQFSTGTIHDALRLEVIRLQLPVGRKSFPAHD